MKDAHLTLRLPEALARALARSARALGVPKSHVAREAVARYLDPKAPSAGARVLRAGELAERWRALPRLTSTEAEEFAAELQHARETLPPPAAKWA